MSLSRSALESTVLAFLAPRQQARGLPALSLTSPVFESGLLDSLGLIDLVAAVEGAHAVELDMLVFDALAVESVAHLVDQLLQACTDV